MRIFHSLLCLAVAAVVLLGNMIFEVGHGLAGHLHLMPETPRSIVQTRRMGLA